MIHHVDVAVVGGGQAGLATSRWLRERSLDHVVLDRGQTGDTWRQRWDSFTLVTPNALLNLPGLPYEGPAPEGFLARDDVVAYLERYRASFNPPLNEGVEVRAVRPRGAGGWHLDVADGTLTARSVVIAAGPFALPSVPALAERLDDSIVQLHSHDYRRPSDLPPGGVLVVGSAQSGCQIVDDLRTAGRRVWLSVGRAGRAPRRYRGRDTAMWMRDMGALDAPVTDPAMRFLPNPHVSGRDGGKDLDLRAFGRDGVRLLGRVVAADGTTVHLANDLTTNLDRADEACASAEQAVERYLVARGIEAPAHEPTRVDWTPSDVPHEVDLRRNGVTSIVWATGFRRDFSWIDAPVFGEGAYPEQQRGVTRSPGLYFVGLPAMHTLGSSLFWGVGRDAEYVVDHIAAA